MTEKLCPPADLRGHRAASRQVPRIECAAPGHPAPMAAPFRAMADDLLTDRLLLRRRQISDGGAIRRLWLERDSRVPGSRRIDAAGRPTVVELEEIISAQRRKEDEVGLFTYAVERRDAPGLIGYCGLIQRDATSEEPEVVFEFARSVHGLGYATEAALAVVEEGLLSGRARSWASVRAWNAASLRVLSKVGFRDSGRRDLDSAHGDTVWMVFEDLSDAEAMDGSWR